MLVAHFDYPDVLRRPAAEVLALFSAGGHGLILVWYAFALTALALAPVAIALAVTPQRLQRMPVLVLFAAFGGVLSGLTQAFGLLRWVFVLPVLAGSPSPNTSLDAEAAAAAFDVLNAYGGVAIGEHLGQLLLVGFVASMAAIQWRESAPRLAFAACLSALAILVGTGEGLALAMQRPSAAFGVATTLGFLGLTAWLTATGIALLRDARTG
jgi:hypothetical protein